MWTSFVSSVFDVNIACWDRAQKFWAGFSLKSKYSVGGMKSGGHGLGWYTVYMFWSKPGD
jgi:hypothetical protein